MRLDLAQTLLSKAMGWDLERATDELEALSTLGKYKFDKYRNFEPGMRFVECLAIWLGQFQREDRSAAYEFVKSRLVFISEEEIAHLVSLVYPDRVAPALYTQCAQEIGVEPFRTTMIMSHPVFRSVRRRTLFLGLSDGARIDWFRRLNPSLSNEQVYVSYEIGSKIEGMVEDLGKSLSKMGSTADASFRNVFLLDDFSGSGSSIIRLKSGGQDLSGKLHKFIDLVKRYPQCFDLPNLQIHVLVYVASERAIEHIQTLATSKLGDYHITAGAIHTLSRDLTVDNSSDPGFEQILKKYYDPTLMDEHTITGETSDLVHGYGGCALPLVLGHNTPNNSVYLLWAGSGRLRPLFRRITRHKVE